MIVLRHICNLILILLFAAAPAAYADWPCRTDAAVPVSTDGGNQWNVRLISDGGNGAILAWQDRRNGLNDKIYIQKMSSSGDPLWTVGGIQLAVTDGFQYYPQLI